MAEAKQAVESRAREVVDELAKSCTELCHRYMSEARVDTPKPATVMPEAFTSAPKPKAPDKADQRSPKRDNRIHVGDVETHPTDSGNTRS